MWAYRLYLLFIVSFFLHMTARIPILAPVRFDFLLVIAITALIIFGKKKSSPDLKGDYGSTAKILVGILVYVIITLPVVRWPGSVLSMGFPSLIKAMVFFFFTISIINTEQRLKTFIVVFMGCQVFRVLEPLYLHQTTGYWGSSTYMVTEMMNRLSGSPYDVVNANGLAFVIVSVIPFLHYNAINSSGKYKFLYFIILPLLLYAMILTASRTGIITLAVVFLVILWKSKKKALYLAVALIAIAVIYPNLSQLQKERYLSITRDDVRGASTASGRVSGIKRDFIVIMERPLFGHGVGTSLEANSNVVGVYLRAHNLYTEIMQELGMIGLILFLMFIKKIIYNFKYSKDCVESKQEEFPYLYNITNAMQAWLLMNIVFSFASYGLTSYEWYLFGGLSVVLRRLSEKTKVPDE